jgi:glycerophosphoryl diester phosphodiesterase
VSNHFPQRVGHGGASALVAGNTLASFDAAQEIGVDVIEFDVRAGAGGLVLAHTILDARRPTAARLGQALKHLSGRRFAGLELHVDVKHVGCEPGLLEELDRYGLLDRALVCSQVPGVLDNMRRLDPRARLGISVGGRVSRLSRRWRDWRTGVLDGLAERRWDAVMMQHRLIGPGLLEDVIARHGHVFAWTVNDRSGIERLRHLGVHGIVSADPRLFEPGGRV